MKAIVQSKYGPPDVLELQEIDKPTPKDNEVLIRVRAAAVNPLDWHDVRGEPYVLRLSNGLLKPKNRVPGVDLAGHLEAVGRKVTQLQPGDEVFGVSRGAFAEYACGNAERLRPKPAKLNFEQAAAVPVAALTALQALRDRGKVKPGQEVLIVGASGGVGTFAVQIAKALGANVTGVCSTKNVDMVRSLGADQVMDYTQEDFTQSGQRYDLIVDMAGTHSLLDCRRALVPRGTYVIVGAPSGRWIKGLDRFVKAIVLSPFLSQKLVPFITAMNQEDLATVTDLIETGRVTPVIDRHYSLSEAPEAVRYVEEGHARGKVVITV